jgi:hypothetical protein
MRPSVSGSVSNQDSLIITDIQQIIIRYVELEMKGWMDRLFGETANTGAPRLIELDEFCGPNLITLQRLAKVFENCAVWLAPYSDERLNRTFWDLSSNVLFVLGDNTIEWALRQRVISSFENLFREFFAVRCKPVLGHLSEEGSPLNMACYMWWEFDCWHSTPSPALLPVMRIDPGD